MPSSGSLSFRRTTSPACQFRYASPSLEWLKYQSSKICKMDKLKIKWCGDIETLWEGHPNAETCEIDTCHKLYFIKCVCWLMYYVENMHHMNNVKVVILLFTWQRNIAEYKKVNSVKCVHWSIIISRKFHCLTLSARWLICQPLVLLHVMPSSDVLATILSV